MWNASSRRLALRENEWRRLVGVLVLQITDDVGRIDNNGVAIDQRGNLNPAVDRLELCMLAFAQGIERFKRQGFGGLFLAITLSPFF